MFQQPLPKGQFHPFLWSSSMAVHKHSRSMTIYEGSRAKGHGARAKGQKPKATEGIPVECRGTTAGSKGMGLKTNCGYLDNGGGLEPNGIQQGGGIMGQLAEGPGHVGQILLAELLNSPFSFAGKPSLARSFMASATAASRRPEGSSSRVASAHRLLARGKMRARMKLAAK
ncbi:MAG: hypothetical protein FRX49_11361 [Trebouxia sp. A1-2]|nr:MAG: hypothetical protein FRX49_11361 [Trebouxia sp. A1-2]